MDSGKGKVDSTESIFDTIPENLEEAMDKLESLPGVEEFKESDPSKYHHVMGQQIRNSWGFWTKEGPLYKQMLELGLEHPDDMSGLVLQTLHNKLNGKPLNIINQVAEYVAFWKEKL